MSSKKPWKFIKNCLVWNLKKSKVLRDGILMFVYFKSMIFKPRSFLVIFILICTLGNLNIIMLLCSLSFKDPSLMAGIQHQQLQWSLISSVEKKLRTLFYLMIMSSPFSMNLVTWCTTCVLKVTLLRCLVPKLKVTSLKCHLRCLKIGSGILIWQRDSANILKLENLWAMKWLRKFLKLVGMVRPQIPCTSAC